ncbi:hypothetical protein DFJ74DRAFT_199499 [Hyaloraphidium curvatum]|nr:hypothetical protein DFJ74DRAFT_199499 [Hyaloraphidium curvatum]
MLASREELSAQPGASAGGPPSTPPEQTPASEQATEEHAAQKPSAKTVLNPLAEAFDFGQDHRITPFYSVSESGQESLGGELPVPVQLASLDDGQPGFSSAMGGMSGFSPFSGATEIFVPPFRADRAPAKSEYAQHVSGSTFFPNRTGIGSDRGMDFGFGGLSSAQEDVTSPGLRGIRPSMVVADRMQRRSEAPAGDLEGYFSPTDQERQFSERSSRNMGAIGYRDEPGARPGFRGRSLADDWSELDQNSYAARGIANWNRWESGGLDLSGAEESADRSAAAGYFGQLGDESSNRPPLSRFSGEARGEPFDFGGARAIRRAPDEFFDSRGNQLHGLGVTRRTAPEDLSFRQPAMSRAQGMPISLDQDLFRAAMPRRPRHPPEPPPPVLSSELAALLQQTGRAQNKTWMETHGSDATMFEPRGQRVWDEPRSRTAEPGYGYGLGSGAPLAGRAQSQASHAASIGQLSARAPGSSPSLSSSGSVAGRFTSGTATDEQLLLQQLSQLPPSQRHLALQRLAQRQMMSPPPASDDRDIAGKLSSLSLSPSFSQQIWSPNLPAADPAGTRPLASPIDRSMPGFEAFEAASFATTPVSGESDSTRIGSPTGQFGRFVEPSPRPSERSTTLPRPTPSQVHGLSRTKKANLDWLPHSILLRVLGFLKPIRHPFSAVQPPAPSPTRDLHSFARVSRKLHFAAVPVLWSRLVLRTDPHVRSCIASVARRVQWQGPGASLAVWTRSIEVWAPVASEVAAALRVIIMEATRAPNGGIQELALTCAPGMDEIILFRMFESSSPAMLETLRLRGAGVTERLANTVVMWCRNVRTVEFSSANLVSVIAYMLENLKLSNLQLHRCLRVTDLTLQAVAAHCKKIEALSLDMSAPTNLAHSRLGAPNSITDRGLVELARTCRRLRSARLVDCDVSDVGLDALVIAGRDLEVVEISTTDAALKTLAALATSGSSYDIPMLASTLPLRNLGDRALQNLFRTCHLLRRFKLSSRHLAYGVPNDSLIRLLHNCPYLEALDISRTRVTDQAIIAAFTAAPSSDLVPLSIATQDNASSHPTFPGLRYLLLHECSELGAGILPGIAAACPRLSVLSLARDSAPAAPHAPNFTDSAIESLVASRGSALRVLDLAFSAAGPGSMKAIAARCGALEVLNLFGCTNVAVADLHPVIESCPQLRILGYDMHTEQVLALIAARRADQNNGKHAQLRLARNKLIWDQWNLVDEQSGYAVFGSDFA